MSELAVVLLSQWVEIHSDGGFFYFMHLYIEISLPFIWPAWKYFVKTQVHENKNVPLKLFGFITSGLPSLFLLYVWNENRFWLKKKMCKKLFLIDLNIAFVRNKLFNRLINFITLCRFLDYLVQAKRIILSWYEYNHYHPPLFSYFLLWFIQDKFNLEHLFI